jgi:hypothetical protein
LKLKESFTDEIVCASLNTNDRYPRFLLICWNDIKQMVYAESACNDNNDEILELDE